MKQLVLITRDMSDDLEVIQTGPYNTNPLNEAVAHQFKDEWTAAVKETNSPLRKMEIMSIPNTITPETQDYHLTIRVEIPTPKRSKKEIVALLQTLWEGPQALAGRFQLP